MEPIWDDEAGLNETLWRYMKVDRFCEMIDSSQVYFAAAVQFPDVFEGATAVIPPEIPIDPRYQEMDFGEEAFFGLKRMTMLNCWHQEEYESDAMWKLYAGFSKGVAIASSLKSMQEAFDDFRLKPEYGAEPFVFGNIHYEDLTQIRLNVSDLERFFYKHRAFSWEKEFRLAISLRIATEYGVFHPQGNGIYVPVRLNKLIEKIILGPEVSDLDKERINNCLDKVGLKDKIHLSSLRGTPKYI